MLAGTRCGRLVASMPAIGGSGSSEPCRSAYALLAARLSLAPLVACGVGRLCLDWQRLAGFRPMGGGGPPAPLFAGQGPAHREQSSRPGLRPGIRGQASVAPHAALRAAIDPAHGLLAACDVV